MYYSRGMVPPHIVQETVQEALCITHSLPSLTHCTSAALRWVTAYATVEAKTHKCKQLAPLRLLRCRWGRRWLRACVQCRASLSTMWWKHHMYMLETSLFVMSTPQVVALPWLGTLLMAGPFKAHKRSLQTTQQKRISSLRPEGPSVTIPQPQATMSMRTHSLLS